MPTVIKPKRSETALAIPSAGSLAVGELAMNITDGKFYTKTSGGSVVELGGAGSISLQDVVVNGSSSNQDILLDGANLVFEGFLANAFETTLTVEEPTVDRTVTLPDRTGTVPVIETGRNIVIEGTSYETTINTTDPTTNRTVTLPDRTGTVPVIETGRNIVVEGTSYDTTLTTTDPTADRTITFQNASGTVITTGNLTVDGTTTGDVLVGEGDSLAYAIVFGS
jgi:hypothetical protein